MSVLNDEASEVLDEVARAGLAGELSSLTHLFDSFNARTSSTQRNIEASSLCIDGFADIDQAREIIGSEAGGRGAALSDLQPSPVLRDDYRLRLDYYRDNDPLKELKFSSLSQALQVQLDASSKALEADRSGANAQRVLLETLVRFSELATECITVPQHNTPGESVRTAVFSVYHRVAKLLGRNTQEAVFADTKAMLISLGDRIVHNPGPGRRGGIAPSQHIKDTILPLLDSDMETAAYAQNIYRFPKMLSFHNLIGTWRSRQRDLGDIKASR